MNITGFLLILSLILTVPGADEGSSIVPYPRKSRAGIQKLFKCFPAVKKCVKLKNGLNKLSKKDFSMFRTIIGNASEEEANFGGKYVVSEWGAGTECQAGVIIDLETGIIYELPVSCWGREYKLDSLLLINNPPLDASEYTSKNSDDNFKVPWYAWPCYYLWKDDHFELLYNTSPGDKNRKDQN